MICLDLAWYVVPVMATIVQCDKLPGFYVQIVHTLNPFVYYWHGLLTVP